MEDVLQLFNAKSKSTLARVAAGVTVSLSDMVALSVGAQHGALAPYKYACAFREILADHLQLKADDLDALAGHAESPERIAKAHRKIGQSFDERRHIASHLFYAEDHEHWLMFYFDNRDLAGQHWRHGSHIHLVTNFWNLDMLSTWERVRGGDGPGNSLHVRWSGEMTAQS